MPEGRPEKPCSCVIDQGARNQSCFTQPGQFQARETSSKSSLRNLNVVWITRPRLDRRSATKRKKNANFDYKLRGIADRPWSGDPALRLGQCFESSLEAKVSWQQDGELERRTRPPCRTDSPIGERISDLRISPDSRLRKSRTGCIESIRRHALRHGMIENIRY